VYKENEKIYVEFEGNRGQIMSYLYVGAFAYHMRRIRVATDELEKIENELTTEVLEGGKRNSHREETRNAPTTEEPILEVEEECDEEEWYEEEEEEEDGEEVAQEEEEEEPPRKMMRMRRKFWGVCRTSDYDTETMEPYPLRNDQLKNMLSEKGLVAYLLKSRDEEPDSEDDRRLIPTGNKHIYENVPHENEYENTFNVTENY
jgi:hypothetical protein